MAPETGGETMADTDALFGESVLEEGDLVDDEALALTCGAGDGDPLVNHTGISFLRASGIYPSAFTKAFQGLPFSET
jgi:hypothetical protein